MSGDRRALAAALRRARAQVRPEHVGLAAGAHRRVPGLRREEVALLAGVSVDYVVRLEQGRGPHPSQQVLTALTQSLRLDDAGRDEVFHLAGVSPPAPGTIQLHVRASVLRLIDRFADLPTMVISAKGDVLAWNAMSSALHGDWTLVPDHRRNLNRLRFLPDPRDPPRSRVGASAEEAAETAAQSVAGLRAAAARYPADPGLQELLGDLREHSPQFRQLWDTAGAGGWRSHRKTVEHPSIGRLLLECDTLHVPDADQAVVVYSAEPRTAAAEALALLRVIETRQLTD